MPLELETKIAWLQKENDSLLEMVLKFQESERILKTRLEEMEKVCAISEEMKLSCTRILNRIEQDENVEQWVLDDLRTALSLGK